MKQDLSASLTPRTAAKTREDIISVGSEEVSVARMAHPRMCGERSSAQHLAGAEPGQRVVAVWMGRKTRVGLEGRCGPLPDLPEPDRSGACSGGGLRGGGQCGEF